MSNLPTPITNTSKVPHSLDTHDALDTREDDTPKPLMHHMIELRRRLIYCAVVFCLAFVVCYSFSEHIFEFLVAPLAQLLKGQSRRLIYTNLTEAFLTYIKVGLFGAFALTFPLISVQIWAFIAPGLYRKEKRFVAPILLGTPLLFFAGAAFAYYVVFPLAYSFFLSFESAATPVMLAIQLEAKVSEYLSFVMRLILAFGICFEMPIIFALLGRCGIITSGGLIRMWRLAVVGISALAALITPPDVLSMVALALPLILLYGVSILVVRCLEVKTLNTL